jgi:hypothetical protein
VRFRRCSWDLVAGLDTEVWTLLSGIRRKSHAVLQADSPIVMEQMVLAAAAESGPSKTGTHRLVHMVGVYSPWLPAYLLQQILACHSHRRFQHQELRRLSAGCVGACFLRQRLLPPPGFRLMLKRPLAHNCDISSPVL